jgi:hypothetical protein
MKKYFEYIGVAGVVVLAVVAYALYGTSNNAPGLPPVETINYQQATVEPKKLSDQEIYDQLKGEYLALAKTGKADEALGLLQLRVEKDQFLLNHCHALVHEIGHVSYQLYGNLDTALKFQNSVCNSGYLHGVIEEYMAGVTDIFAAIKTMCVGRDEGRCHHGMGHGLMYYTANDLPKSLSYCEALKGGNPIAYCAQGVYMENFNTDLKLHPSEFLKEEDPSYPCPVQKEGFKNSCYYYAPTFFLSQNGRDFEAALPWCASLAEEKYRGTCARGVGALAIKSNISKPRLVEAICMKGVGNQVPNCIDGMVGLYMNHYDSVIKGKQMCSLLESQNQEVCLAGVYSRSALFTD